MENRERGKKEEKGKGKVGGGGGGSSGGVGVGGEGRKITRQNCNNGRRRGERKKRTGSMVGN